VVQRRPELGVSFGLLAPLAQQRANFVLGQEQTAANVERVSPTEVQIVWKDPVGEHGGVVPLVLTATAMLVNGVLTFNATLVNNSSLTIETIDYPYFGDFTSPRPETPMHTERLWIGALNAEEIYPHFNNGKGYWGVLYNGFLELVPQNAGERLHCYFRKVHMDPILPMAHTACRTLVDKEGAIVLKSDEIP
jgi:hypothetical protein